MDEDYLTFSAEHAFYHTKIPVGLFQYPVERFIQEFSEKHGYQQLTVIDPERGWQMCEYEGRVVVGVFDVYTLIDGAPVSLKVAFIDSRLPTVTRSASMWFRQHRQRSTDGYGLRPSVDVEPHGAVKPITTPPNWKPGNG